ncbi:MAG TPA: GNAT family N-acetyltransferase [Gemmatimonadaceae bacterium]
MEIGTLRPHHRPRLADLLEATDAFNADEIEVALSLFDLSATTGAASADYEFIGAFDDGRLVGYACFGPTPVTQGTYDLYWLAVHPAAQRSGVGRALVRDVRAKLAARGGRLLLVETSSRAEYARTREFYTHAGFAEAARVRDFYAPADDRIMLTTRLTTREGGVATR